MNEWMNELKVCYAPSTCPAGEMGLQVGEKFGKQTLILWYWYKDGNLSHWTGLFIYLKTEKTEMSESWTLWKGDNLGLGRGRAFHTGDWEG